MPAVSVVIPTYNRASYIGEALESVLSQTFKDWELIVVDDGSTDNTQGVIKSFLNKDNRIRCIRQENRGAVAARNKALEVASGKYVAFLDDDDRWLPDKLEMQVKVMESDPEIGFCYMRFQIYKKVENRLEKGKLFPEFLATKFEELPDVFIAPCSAMFRKSCLDCAGLFDTRYKQCDDFDFWLRIGQICKIQPIDKIGAFTVMDGRTHNASNELKVWQTGIDILTNLKLTPQYQHCKGLVKTHIAKRYCWIAREYLDRRSYWPAALNFTKALLTDSLIGLAVTMGEPKGIGKMTRVLKFYMTVPACLVKGLIHGRR